MAFFSDFFDCFLDSGRVTCEGDGCNATKTKSSKDKSTGTTAPIPLPYFFPIGTTLSRL
uniref:Uncharacterized protein n=1 Tax=Nelumbo nucifera TaxID=4432 RepID=A0A822XX86_NELNU|nr:TPA_asm: hypothetical protein HUJ06_024848 [Nelumbo nucifera]